MNILNNNRIGKRANYLFLSVLSLISLGFVSSAIGQRASVVTWTARVEPAKVKPDAKAKIQVTAQMSPGWHLYSLTQGEPLIATKVSFTEDANFKSAGAATQPKPKVAFDPNFQLNTETFEGSVTFTVPIKVKPTARPGKQQLTLSVRFQTCNDRLCLPPKTETVTADVFIENASQIETVAPPVAQSPQTPTQDKPAETAASQPAQQAPAVSSNSPQSLPDAAVQTASAAAPVWKSSGILRYIWFAMGFGFLALLTPCVFPMIPITVSFFTKNEQRTYGAAIKQATVYCVGIIATFTGLGMALALIAGPTGINKVAANPWMNLFLMGLFVVFALNLFGAFEIRLPSSILTKLDKKSSGGTFVATLLMGLTFTLTSFTCTAAFVGTVLVAATQGQWFWSAIGMLAFSTAFALPFFLLAMFPQYLRSLPSSGGWMNSVKVVMGFLELAAAFKFLSNVDLVWGWKTISRELVLAGWIAIAIITTIYLLGKFRLANDSPVERLSAVRLLASTFFLGLAFYLLAGLFGTPMGSLDAFLPPASASVTKTSSQSGAQDAWLSNYDKALEQARQTHKPVFVNFTGVTCTNCRWMESNMFTDQEIKNKLGSFILAELYTDRQNAEDEQNSKLQEKQFSTVALPLYVIVDGDGHLLAQFAGLTRDKNEFMTFLKAGADRFSQTISRN